MTTDRIKRLAISGFKCINELSIPLEGLTVLIGENGSGKSAILDALHIVASAASRVQHIPDVIETRFGRFEKILRSGSSSLRVEVTIGGNGPDLSYGFSIGQSGTYAVVLEEWLTDSAIAEASDENRFLIRSADKVRFKKDDGVWATTTIGDQALSPSYVGAGASEKTRRLLAALEGIDVQPPFDVRPIGQQKDLKINEGPRWPVAVEAAPRLKRYGSNLASAYHQLRNMGGEAWERVLTTARLGFGGDLRDIRMPAAGRGLIEVELVFGAMPDFPLAAEFLSEGQLSYLAFIALCALNGRTVLAIDEPELHLHPALLARVVWMLEEVSARSPVIVATHSDRLLDALDSPAQSVMLCELDETRTTRLRRADEATMKEWIEEYGGLGRARTEGFEAQMFTQEKVQGGDNR